MFMPWKNKPTQGARMTVRCRGPLLSVARSFGFYHQLSWAGLGLWPGAAEKAAPGLEWKEILHPALIQWVVPSPFF
jgi:hypothetical protein